MAALSLPNPAHPAHWPPQRYRLESQRLIALGELEAAAALAAAHATGETWQGVEAFLSQRERKAV